MGDKLFMDFLDKLFSSNRISFDMAREMSTKTKDL